MEPMTYLKTYGFVAIFLVMYFYFVFSSERSEPTPPRNDTVYVSYHGDSIYGVEVRHRGIWDYRNSENDR